MAEVVSVPGSDTLLRRKLREILSTGVATMLANELGRSAFHAGSPILQIRDLRTSLLKPASLSVTAGECIAVRGPSGAGKTLLLRAIADLDPSDSMTGACLGGCTGTPARRAARLVAVAAQRGGGPYALPGQAAPSQPWGNQVDQDSIGETQQTGSEFNRR